MEFILEIICPKKIKNEAYVTHMRHIGLLCKQKILKLFILTTLELNMFLKKFKNLLDI